jgi:hypothetical protein
MTIKKDKIVTKTDNSILQYYGEEDILTILPNIIKQNSSIAHVISEDNVAIFTDYAGDVLSVDILDALMRSKSSWFENPARSKIPEKMLNDIDGWFEIRPKIKVKKEKETRQWVGMSKKRKQ